MRDNCTNNTNNCGLFSIPELQHPDDFATMTQAAIRNGNRLRSTVAAMAATAYSTSSNDSYSHSNTENRRLLLLHQLDDISKIVCNVIDAAELCRSVHVDAKWRDAAQTAYTQLAAYIGILNADTSLYRALTMLERTSGAAVDNDNKKNTQQLESEEQDRFAKLLRAEFERDGIHLPDAQRAQVQELQSQITQLEGSFSFNLVNSRREFAIDNTDDDTSDPDEPSTTTTSTTSMQSAVTNVIPASVLQQHYGIEISKTSNNTDNNTAMQLGDTDSAVLQTLLKYSDHAPLRQTVHWHSVTAIPENLLVLEELRRTRHALAVTQGFASYSHRGTNDNRMVSSPLEIDTFLRDATLHNQAVFRQEMNHLVLAKRRFVQRDTSTDDSYSSSSSTLEPWDMAFYKGLLTARNGDLLENISQYLTVSNTLEAMQFLVDRLFGIVMKEERLSPVEQWDLCIEKQHEQGNSSSLRKYSFASNHGLPLGTMYLDLHPREGKYSHAAHFTVRCGCAIHWDTDETDIKNESENYQLPIVALVCNLSSRTQLSHSEVETLFHEFGHALHSLLSRTQFQHMSGTRSAMDFVETPSHLFENFAWDTQFLQQILGRHVDTGEPMPDAMIAQLRQSRTEFAAIERQNQILYATLDQKLFGVPDDDSLGQSVEKTMALFGNLHEQFGIPYTKGTHWYSRFGHLVSYGAGYYGYLYSQGFARDIWARYFEGNSLDRSVGELVWKKLLVHGGAKDPRTMLDDLLKR